MKGSDLAALFHSYSFEMEKKMSVEITPGIGTVPTKQDSYPMKKDEDLADLAKQEQIPQKLHQESEEPDPIVWRGIFAPTHRRKILFSQRLKICTNQLPKWKPHLTIDRHTLARAEDE
ncbi:hypothetical protein HYR99_30890 [Candidatus Poribacteria bacterium]|nr:hypothetical protein [Candidatus Poribacteria bacterium]